MGNWNWRPRRTYRQKASNSPTRWQQPELSVSDLHDNIPSWEKKFCSRVGSVQWWRIVNAKKFIHCYPNIQQWDDSAAKDAFDDAKARFFSQINGSQCDTCLPDQDIYIDKIDWNPTIDPELISDLDREYVCPDAVSNGTWEPATRAPEKQEKDENPWDRADNIEDNGNNVLKIGGPTGWGRWGPESNRVENENPWESKDVKTWGWNKEGDGQRGVRAADYSIPGRGMDSKKPWEKNWESNNRKREGSVQYLGWCRNAGFQGDGNVWNSKIRRSCGQERFNDGRF